MRYIPDTEKDKELTKEELQDIYEALFAIKPMTKAERRAYYSQTKTYKDLRRKKITKKKTKRKSETEMFEPTRKKVLTEPPQGSQLEIKERLSKLRPMTKAERRRYYSQTNVYKEFEKKYKLGHTEFDPTYFEKIVKLLLSSGILVDSYRERFLIRRIRSRMLRTETNTLKSYFKYLKSSNNEIELMKKSLSILVTRFFRDRDTYDYIRENVLESFAHRIQTIKIWSAGCADGAEPYSLAILFQLTLPSSKYQIIATDFEEELIKAANGGIYNENYLMELSGEEIDQYFRRIDDLNYEIKREIRQSVSFSILDLILHNFPTNVDLIFCRNVLIYFDDMVNHIIIEKFYTSLNLGGYLVLGRTEILDAKFDCKFNLVSSRHRIYKKIA